MTLRLPGIGCLTLSLALGGAVTRASAADLPSEFVRQYQAATAEFTRCYSHATVTGTLLREYPQQGKRIEQHCVLRASGKRLRLDITNLAQENMDATIGKVMTYVATPVGSLETCAAPRPSSSKTPASWATAKSEARIETLCPLMSPFKAAGQGTVLELLQGSGIRVVSSQRIHHDGEELVRVVFDEHGGAAGASPSYFLLSPQEGWALREYYRVTGSGESQRLRRGRIAYEGMHEGAALVKRIECWDEQGPKRRCTLHEVVTVSNFDPTEPRDYYFTSFAF